jgi:hypothetical protein
VTNVVFVQYLYCGWAFVPSAIPVKIWGCTFPLFPIYSEGRILAAKYHAGHAEIAGNTYWFSISAYSKISAGKFILRHYRSAGNEWLTQCAMSKELRMQLFIKH